MYSYKDQLEIIQNIKLSDGDRKTIDCPFCGGKKKFTIDKYDGKIVWNCYKASCNAKGAYNGKRSVDAAKAYLSNNATQRKKTDLLPCPKIQTKADNHPPAIDYLKSVNSWEAYQRGYIKVTYAPAEDRVLFHSQDGLGAVGRSLRPAKAKWWSYGSLEHGIAVGIGDHAILVEDVASACSVSRVDGLVGVALLGTNITKGIRKTLNKYKKVTLVLDNDAASKAVCVARRYSCVNSVRLTNKDLKWLTCDQIREII